MFFSLVVTNPQKCGGKESGRDGDDADADNEDEGGKDPPAGRNGVDIDSDRSDSDGGGAHDIGG